MGLFLSQSAKSESIILCVTVETPRCTNLFLKTHTKQIFVKKHFWENIKKNLSKQQNLKKNIQFWKTVLIIFEKYSSFLCRMRILYNKMNKLICEVSKL